jgi:hypothetical protein
MSLRIWTGAIALVVAGGGASAADGSQCIGLALPSVQGANGDASQLGTAVRDLFATYLTGPSLRPAILDARLPAMAAEEARDKACGHLLIVRVTHKRGGGGTLGRAVGEAAQTAAWHTPVGSPTAAMARGAAVAGGQAIVSLSQSTRAKDELRLEYTLSSPATGMVAGSTTFIGKAKIDGEDVLTPIVERAAQAIATRLAAP